MCKNTLNWDICIENCHLGRLFYGRKLYVFDSITQLHSEQPKLYGVLAVLSALGLTSQQNLCQ